MGLLSVVPITTNIGLIEMRKPLTRRQRLEALIAKYPTRAISWELMGIAARHKLEIYTDETIEELFNNLHSSEQFTRRINDENRSRFAAWSTS